MHPALSAERKYFLDWLRVAAFGVLILFHVGLLYVPWGYNLDSDRLLPGLEYVLISISPWRLALLFFISGVASRFLLDKLSPGRFTLDRFKRLFVVCPRGITAVGSLAVYEALVRRWWISRLLFGLRNSAPAVQSTPSVPVGT